MIDAYRSDAGLAKISAVEIVGILRKLPDPEFDRLVELANSLPSTSWWVVQDMLSRGRA